MTKIAFLATGDELANGDVINTNSQKMAQQLFDHGFDIGLHLICNDEQTIIADQICYLIEEHDALIISGGLGPTSDDRTRHALSEATELALELNEKIWHEIEAFLEKVNPNFPRQANRQQALFPKGALPLINPKGSAPGCKLNYQGKIIYLLPGPPHECLPMFDDHVFPDLITCFNPPQHFYKKWYLFNVSEAQMATDLDQLVAGLHCTMGYRAHYPYLECKLMAQDVINFEKAKAKLLPQIEANCLAGGHEPASTHLRHYIAANGINLSLSDSATGGAIERELRTAKTHHLIHFIHHPTDALQPIHFEITGLDEVWQQQTSTTTSVTLKMTTPTQRDTFSQKIPLRGQRSLRYAVEYLSLEMFSYLKQYFK